MSLKALIKQRDVLDNKLALFEKYVTELSREVGELGESHAISSKNALPDVEPIVEPFASTIAHAIVEANAASAESVKLPTIELPKFNGEFEHWLEFRDTFHSLIHSNDNISSIQKYHYLRASVEGKASQVINYLEFTAINYDVAWKMLCDRFNNEKLLIQNHVKAIFDLEVIQKESSQKIRALNDSICKHLTNLKQLGEPVDHWDTLIIYIASGKLDKSSAREWERQKVKDSPTLKNFNLFLRNRADLLETFESNLAEQRPKQPAKQVIGLVATNDDNQGGQRNICSNCKQAHNIFHCPDYLKLTVQDRFAKVKQLKLCINCLRQGHEVKACRAGGCRICQAKHNTSLHDASKVNRTQKVSSSDATDTSNKIETNRNITCATAAIADAILSTALVYVYDSKGGRHKVRALLDCGSQSSFITSDLQKNLQLCTTKVNLTLAGVSEHLSHIQLKSAIKVASATTQFCCEISCFILDKITGYLPNSLVNKSSIKIPNNIKLADPQFHVPGQIDLLIGADIFWSLLCVGQIKLNNEGTILQKTRFGWVIAGPFHHEANVNRTATCHLSKVSNVQDQLKQFWEIEEIPNKKHLSKEESLCEKHFCENLEVNLDGRYVVSLPFKADVSALGESLTLAIKRFYQLEKQLSSNDNLRQLYVKFMNEYESLGHMSKTHAEDEFPDYYMPHHGVMREDHLTTKLRVVFNASAASSTGICLNSLQMTGPIIQDDLISILLRFRLHKIILSSDIRMMYRQVLVNPKHRRFQKIVWRESPSASLSTYTLNTVTYGTTSASFLAIRCLHEVANEIECQDSALARIIKRDMYVDDLLTGCDDENEAKQLCINLMQTLKSRDFELRKWRSNHAKILEHLVNEETETGPLEFTINKELACKTLGLSWQCESDTLNYTISSVDIPKRVTKRTILSRIATIFDPLGLVSPCIIVAKIMLQQLWKENLSWDESLIKHGRNSLVS